MKLSEILAGKVELKQPSLSANTILDFTATMKAWTMDEEDGIFTVDRNAYFIYELLFVVQSLHEIELDTMFDEEGEIEFGKMLSTYDVLAKLNEDKFFMSGSVQDICDIIRNNIEKEVAESNSFARVLNAGMTKLIEKIPSISTKDIDRWMKKLPQILDKMSPENKEMINNVLKMQK